MKTHQKIVLYIIILGRIIKQTFQLFMKVALLGTAVSRLAPKAFLLYHPSFKILVSSWSIWNIDGNVKRWNKELHAFMFSSLMFALSWVFLDILFEQNYLLSPFRFSVEHLSKIQHTSFEKYNCQNLHFPAFQFSKLTIRNYPILGCN